MSGAVDDTAVPPGGASASPDEADQADRPRARHLVHNELLLALEVMPLAAFAFSRPVLDSFGRSPETFIARGAGRLTVVAFGLVVALVPAAVLASVGTASRPFGPRVRQIVQAGLVALAGGAVVWRLGQELTGWPPVATKLQLAGVLGAAALAAARQRFPAIRTFLRFSSAVIVVYLVQFLAMSPAADLIFARGGVDSTDAAAVAADLGDDPPDVVLVVFDALPTMSLLDGRGRIDAEAFPNFAAFAATSTWYRDNSSVAAFTADAVPAILTGRYPDPDAAGTPDPENLFTLLGGSYDVHAAEQVTRLCPPELCPLEQGDGLPRLLGDALDLWWAKPPSATGQDLNVPGALGDERFVEAAQWIDGQDYQAGDRPGLFFLHVVMPHGPWEFLPDGRVYQPATDLPVGSFGLGWPGPGIPVGRQRHLLQLQAADRLLGQLLDRLQEAGTFDDSLVVVTADHGEAFTVGEPARALSAGNCSEIAWTPLLVKEPGQRSAVVDDGNVETIDIMPTIADVLGVDVPWALDGRPVAESGERDPDVKLIDDNEDNRLRSADGEPRVELDARAGFARVLAADGVPGEGPDGVWWRTRYGGLLRREMATVGTGDATDETVDVENLGALDSVSLDEPLPIEVVGHTDLEVGTVVAYVLNGTIAAVADVEPDYKSDGGQMAHALLVPDHFVHGGNDLEAYVVEGRPGAETLRPVGVTGATS